MKTESQVRAAIVANARWGVAHQSEIHYRETRPIPVKHPARQLPLTTDCSGFATLCYLWAGAPDPNGLGYNGSGYTGTLLDHGQRITAAEVKPGDLVVYGTQTVPDGHHVVVVVEAGSDPLTVSHGGERGPLLITVRSEVQYQPPGVVYLRFPLTVGTTVTRPKRKPVARPGKANPQPPWYTAALRAPPLWAWISWRDHGAPKRMRPAQVPRVVPPTWWGRYLLHKHGPTKKEKKP